MPHHQHWYRDTSQSIITSMGWGSVSLSLSLSLIVLLVALPVSLLPLSCVLTHHTHHTLLFLLAPCRRSHALRHRCCCSASWSALPTPSQLIFSWSSTTNANSPKALRVCNASCKRLMQPLRTTIPWTAMSIPSVSTGPRSPLELLHNTFKLLSIQGMSLSLSLSAMFWS
jgi:hypothetical protein